MAYHGWGFSSSIWRNWKAELSQFGSFAAYDRGYFSTEQNSQKPSAQEPIVLLSHSFGLHGIEQSLFQQADLLIIISGFLRFHPVAAQYKRRSRTMLQQMMNEFEIHPEKVLQNYYANCYAPREAPNKSLGKLDHQLLLDDLKWLNRSIIEADKLKKVNKICIIHGSDDHIVPKKKGREIFNQLPEQSQYFEIKKAGHALPVTHSQQCLDFIKPEIVKLFNKADRL